MNYGAFRPRTPPLPRRPGYYTMQRDGYLSNPLQPIPLIRSGYAIDHRPYPSREFPDLPQATTPPVVCPPGSVWSPYDRACKATAPTAQFRGLGSYLSPEVAKKWEWDSFAVGLGAMAATMTLGIAASLIISGSQTRGKKDPRVDMSLIPSLIPGMGAGLIAYLLRWHTNNLCPCEEGEEELRARVGETTTTAATRGCPQGYVMTPRGCEELI